MHLFASLVTTFFSELVDSFVYRFVRKYPLLTVTQHCKAANSLSIALYDQLIFEDCEA